MLSKENIKQFQILCEEEEGLELSFDQAREEGQKLLRLFEIVYGSPLSEKEFKTLKKNKAVQNNN